MPSTPIHIKNMIIQALEPATPKYYLSEYCRAIEPWFPIVAATRLRDQIPTSWDEASLDVALLYLSIMLLTTLPAASEFQSLYLRTKSILASTEGLGLNSLPIVQSRIMVTLFELAHGFYPAAYISIGATLRAADALEVHPGSNVSPSQSSDVEAKHEDRLFTLCGILVLDRYIAVESGSQPSLTRPRTHYLNEHLKPTLCPTHEPDSDRNSPTFRLARLVEASSLLDKIHNTLNSPTAEDAFNDEELILTAQTAINLQTILNEDIGGGVHLYAGGLALCQTALLLAFENGTKVSFTTGTKGDCSTIAATSLVCVLSTINSSVEVFTSGMQSIEFDSLPPFAILLVSKAAAITTERLLMDRDSKEGLDKLKILRKFLKIMGERWLSCERYLKLLDEDTTPRILKAVE